MGALQRLDGSTRVMLSELIFSNRRRASDELWEVVEPPLPPNLIDQRADALEYLLRWWESKSVGGLPPPAKRTSSGQSGLVQWQAWTLHISQEACSQKLGTHSLQPGTYP
jgi:hypothetical protein